MDNDDEIAAPSTEETARSWSVLFWGNCVLGYLLMIPGTPRILVAIPFLLVGWALYEMRPRTGVEGGAKTGLAPGLYWVLLVFLSIGPLTALLVLSIA